MMRSVDLGMETTAVVERYWRIDEGKKTMMVGVMLMIAWRWADVHDNADEYWKVGNQQLFMIRTGEYKKGNWALETMMILNLCDREL